MVKRGIATSRITAKGYGKSKPIGGKATRRIEIDVVK